ncbi:unnamed protein product [Dibothriocephalus latus]|uniref:Uncharacterized protein n=1 Tax=Dibothriocephalus latus TaxID=60516 RepID=A0A3P7LFC9_DIBLA|nr:unnamed protein product [Dibothriocephalus latus]
MDQSLTKTGRKPLGSSLSESVIWVTLRRSHCSPVLRPEEKTGFLVRDAIAVLNLSNNSLREVPDEISRFSSLKSLDLSKNNFGSEDEQNRVGFFARKRRTKLNNELLPSSLVKLTSLQQLKMSSCGLRQIPPVIFQLGNLRVLDISRNSIATISAEIGKLSELRRLDASHTSLLELPTELSMCTKMTHIKIFATKICKFSDDYSKFDMLKFFNFNFSALLAPTSGTGSETEASRQLPIPSEFPPETDVLPKFIFKLPNLRRFYKMRFSRLAFDALQRN